MSSAGHRTFNRKMTTRMWTRSRSCWRTCIRNQNGIFFLLQHELQ
jgi:hypothetical protein